MLGEKVVSIRVEGPEVVFVIRSQPMRRAGLVWGAMACAMAVLVVLALMADDHSPVSELSALGTQESGKVNAVVAQQLAQAKDASAVCLQKQGLTQEEIKHFAAGTMCIGRKVSQHLGVGDPMQMAKNYLQAHGNHKDVMSCLRTIDTKSAKAAHTCAKEMPTQVQASPVVQFWLKNLAA